MTEDELKTLAEVLWEELGGDLCICQRQDVLHWCEECQVCVGCIRAALQRVQEAMQVERDNARANASILAHAYEHDSRPPSGVVAESLAYPRYPARPGVEEAPRDDKALRDSS